MSKIVNDQDAMLRVEGFSKRFFLHEQVKCIPSAEDVNLCVHAGRLTALTGPTGAGKSSVLKGIYRTYKPQAGRLLYRKADGAQIDLAQADDHQVLELRCNEIGFVTQFLHALPRQAALDVVAQPLYHRGEDRAQARQQAGELLAQLNVPEHLWELSPSTFSGGEKQRINLARGFIAGPRLLLLDEPTASLDPVTTERVVTLIEAMKQRGVAMLAIFHQPELVTRLADEQVRLSAPVTNNDIHQPTEDVA
jgi:alpha-D-ribose 1-methylphosphonate 5-triphosphate synthase subunit PhnL